MLQVTKVSRRQQTAGRLQEGRDLGSEHINSNTFHAVKLKSEGR